MTEPSVSSSESGYLLDNHASDAGRRFDSLFALCERDSSLVAALTAEEVDAHLLAVESGRLDVTTPH